MAKKTQGFHVRIDAFVTIDKTDFGKQAAAYAMMDAIKKTNKLPDDFFTTAVILDINGKAGSAELSPTATSGDQGDKMDPANWPLTTDPLPEGATVIESTTDLAGHIFQTIKLADETETFRRITAEQDAAEQATATEMVGDKVTKRGGKPAE